MFKMRLISPTRSTGDPATADSNDGASVVTADREPEHGEDRDDGQGAWEEQQDRGGDG